MMRVRGINSKGVLVGVAGLLALAVSAAAWGITNLGASDPRSTYNPTPSPEKIAQVREILFADAAVQGILAGRHEGRDYWMRIDMMYERENVEKAGEPNIAGVAIWADPPLVWEGETPTISDPCQGHYHGEGELDKQDTCIYEPREYGTEYEKFDGGVEPFIDLRLGRVVNIAPLGSEPEAIRGVKKLYAIAGTPEQDARVREILLDHEAVKSMTAGMEEGTNFWIGAVGYIYADGEPLTSDEKTIAMVDIFFASPLEWSGLLPNRLEPCQREHEQARSSGQTGWPDRADPCWSAPPQYETQPRKLGNAPGVYADIDLRSGEILNMDGLAPKPSDLENAKERYAR